MALQYLDAAGTATSAGIFIPRDNLNGLTANSELASGESTITKQCKFLAAFLATFQSTLAANRANSSSLATGLGFALTKGNPIGSGQGRFSQTFIATFTTVFDNTDNTAYPIPVPTAGTSNGKGILKITDIFPDALAVAASGAISEAGVVIPHTDVDMYGAESTTAVDNDTQSRKWFAAVFRMLFDTIPQREAGVTQSALTVKALNEITQYDLADSDTASTNPTTGLSSSELTMLDIYSRSIQFSIEYLINEVTQTFDVRVA
ncbi:hypothetical protein V0288_09200 [Pannus brasiliensis CCIBt3594]|uniref:Uncharacterized protein n=1 Tax=Pannus brasiliensis CCIBt3594 TaxID=1427578 RepID=A0AAW9QX00_9CHRO